MKKMIENMIKDLPDFLPDDKFVNSLMDRINGTNKNSKYKFINLVLNYVTVFSVILFCATTVFRFFIIKNKTNEIPSQSISVEVALNERLNILDGGDDNVLFIFDENNNYAEMDTNYKLEGNKLFFNIKPGIYKIIFSSEKFENVSITKIIAEDN